MGEVHLEVMPLLAPYFGATAPGHLRVSEAIADGETIRDVLNRLADRYAGIDGVVFDRQSQTLTGHVRLVLNERVVELAGGLDTVLADGDTMLLLPAFAGGAVNESRRRMLCQ